MILDFADFYLGALVQSRTGVSYLWECQSRYAILRGFYRPLRLGNSLSRGIHGSRPSSSPARSTIKPQYGGPTLSGSAVPPQRMGRFLPTSASFASLMLAPLVPPSSKDCYQSDIQGLRWTARETVVLSTTNNVLSAKAVKRN